jgi:phosphonate transport system substrate-binding protein
MRSVITSPSTGLAFAVPPLPRDQQSAQVVDALSRFLADRIGVDVQVITTVSYDDLAHAVMSGRANSAWLPPAVFVELERSVGMRAVACAERGPGVGYFSAFITLIDSDVASLDQIPGHSIAWVDSSSAAGYVYPRLQLAAHGIDPATAFQEEVFLRSHEAVVRAVLDRAVDLGATYVHLDPTNPRKVIRAGWRPFPSGVDTSGIQWFDPFGPLPPDVIATTVGIAEDLASRLGEAFLTIHHEEAIIGAARQHFGTGHFVQPSQRAYDLIRRSMDQAEGLGIEVTSSLRP